MTSLLKILRLFPKAKIMVIGDIMADLFIWGHVSRISPEAPVPIIDVKNEVRRLGGAGNVAHNVHSLKGKVRLCGILGDDPMGNWVSSQLKEIGIDTGGILVEKKRPTTTKTRIVAHNQQVVRFDREVTDPIDDSLKERIIAFFKDSSKRMDALIISDYGKGVIFKELLEEIALTRKKREGLLVSIDPKVDNFPFYKGVTIITPNEKEASIASGIEIKNRASLLAAGKNIIERTMSQSLLITEGEQGMTLFENQNSTIHIPTFAKEVYDVTGAGDTVISALTLSLASGSSLREAAQISNFAAGVVVEKLGTATVSLPELRKKIMNHKGTIKIEAEEMI